MSNFKMPSEDVFRAREKVVLDHFHDEVRHAWDDVLSTFPHPHYELIAPMRVHDGDREVRQYFHDSLTGTLNATVFTTPLRCTWIQRRYIPARGNVI